MCKWGTTKRVRVRIPADISHTGKERLEYKPIDACIAPLVRLLQDIGTRTSCCGHNKIHGNIVLADGRELFIFPDYESARKANDILAPQTIDGDMPPTKEELQAIVIYLREELCNLHIAAKELRQCWPPDLNDNSKFHVPRYILDNFDKALKEQQHE